MAEHQEERNSPSPPKDDDSWTVVQPKTIIKKSYVRKRGKAADVSISTQGIVRNQVQRVLTTPSSGASSYKFAFPFDKKSYKFCEEINNYMKAGERKAFLAEHLVEIEMVVMEEKDTNHDSTSIFGVLSKLRPHFFEETRNLMLKLDISDLDVSEIMKTAEAFLKSSVHSFLTKFVDRLRSFRNLNSLVIILNTSIYDTKDEYLSQLQIVLPFYNLDTFEDWEVKVQHPVNREPKAVSKEDLDRLDGRYHDLCDAFRKFVN